MLSFAAFTPHPPIIIPAIGNADTKYTEPTIEAMQQLSTAIEPFDVDTVVFISPHTTINPESMTISYTEQAAGDFGQFNHPEVNFKAEINLELAEAIEKFSKQEKIPLQLQNHQNIFELDHGMMVPYYFLKQHLPANTRIIIIGFSALSRAQHIAFGQAISKAISKDENNIAVIASGDLSHHILDQGSEFIGQKFDNMIVDAVSSNRMSDILKIDEYLQEEAGECGYRSLLIMLGILEGFEVKTEVLSYQAPFGVGYMVADFNINV